MSLPFVDYKYRISENLKMWFYQNIIDKFIKKSAKRANHIVVQTQWMKNAIVTKYNIHKNKIEVIPPPINIQISKKFSNESWDRSFIYPATGFPYKNHITLFRAVKSLKECGTHDFIVHLTLAENELPAECKQIYKEISDIIDCHGKYSREDLIEMYSKSILVFPSFIETFGLPLLEAKECDDYVVAADTAFAREILQSYKRRSFFEYKNYEELASIMKKFIENEFT